MFDRTELESLCENEDPRVSDASLRLLRGVQGLSGVLIVSVAHDHPASIARVSRVLSSLTTDILALELPPLAIPLFRYYATEESTPPSLGGEMSMAIQSERTARLVGIDVPNWSYLRVIGRHVVRGDIGTETLTAVLADFVRATAQALTCRLLEVTGRLRRTRPRCYTSLEYECSAEDSPERQALHEREHISKQQAFLRAVEIPAATKLIDSIREDSMVRRLHGLRGDGDLVVIVGAEHAEAVANGLRQLAGQPDESS